MTAFKGGFHRSTQHSIIVFVVPGILSLVDENQNAEYHNSYPPHDLACFIKFTLHEKRYLEETKSTQPDENGYRYKSFIWGGTPGWYGAGLR
ncbi:MAG TPA: hypothetical protein VIM35_08540 [Gallionella sp.]